METLMSILFGVCALGFMFLMRGWQSRATRAVQALDGLLQSATTWPMDHAGICDCCASLPGTHEDGCAHQEAVALLRESWAVDAAGD